MPHSPLKAYFSLQKEIQKLKKSCLDPKILIVTKGRTWEELFPFTKEKIYAFGENRLQELLFKSKQKPQLPWHFIGRIQSKKIPSLLKHCSMLHSVDSFELAQKISDTKEGEPMPILLQSNTSGEKSKGGLSPELWQKSFSKLLALPNIRILGLMTIAPLTEDKNILRKCFAGLRELRDLLSKQYSIPLPELSMGMSNDYALALEEGSTLLRIGSKLFVED